MRLTGEQEAVVAAAVEGGRLCVVAGAGTGKTSTLVAVAQAMGRRRGRYLAFNRAVVGDCRRRLPASVGASTAHGLAFQAVGKAFAGRLGSGRMRPEDMAAHLGLGPLPVEVAGRAKILDAGFLAGVAMRAVVNFSHSADHEPVELRASIEGPIPERRDGGVELGGQT
ncbi:MAG: AAA family ATPase [Acidimicrobiales bacterium]